MGPMRSRSEESLLRVHLRVVLALLQREMTTRYGRSAGGYLWAIGEPVGMIALLSVVFSFVVRSPPLGGSFVLFYATGYLAFHFYKNAAEVVGASLGSNKPLMKYPNVNAYDVLVARFALVVLTNCATTALILVGALAATGEPVLLDLGQIALALGLAAFMAAGIGATNAVLFQVYPTWQRVWSILNRPLFLVSGIFFTPEVLPRAAREVLAYNPLIHVVSIFRDGVYPTYRPVLAEPAYPFAIGLVTLFFGLLLLRRFDARLADL